MTIQKRIISIIIIFLAFVGLIIYFVILPAVRDIKAINQAVYLERVDLEKKYLRGQLLRKTIENFEKIKPQKERFVSVFVQENQELEFITGLEKIAANNNLKQELQLQTLDKKNKSGNYYPLDLTITIQGDFVNFLRYLKELENLNYYFNISSLTVNADSPQTISTKLNGEIYILPEVTP